MHHKWIYSKIISGTSLHIIFRLSALTCRSCHVAVSSSFPCLAVFMILTVCDKMWTQAAPQGKAHWKHHKKSTTFNPHYLLDTEKQGSLNLSYRTTWSKEPWSLNEWVEQSPSLSAWLIHRQLWQDQKSPIT